LARGMDAIAAEQISKKQTLAIRSVFSGLRSNIYETPR
jgi:hypothetical protein